jgi:ribosomal protein S18 acetylase RimI-like enzyme
LKAVSERTRTDEQPSTESIDRDEPDNTHTDIPRSLRKPIQQQVSKGVAVEQEFWDDLLSGDEAAHLGHLQSINSVICNEKQECRDDQSTSIENQSSDGNHSLEEDEYGENASDSQSNDDSKDEDSASSDISASLARSAILRRAGVAGGKTRQSSRSNGRSSLAKSHVNKNRRGSPNQGRAIGQVLSTVRTVAAGAAGRKKLFTETEKKEGTSDNNVHDASARLDVGGPSMSGTTKWEAAVQSTISEMLTNQQQAEPPPPPPPGTTTMGILGEVVQETFPAIPPLPGKVLVLSQPRPDLPPISIRSSIPHSSDDTHIANLRLSVFSNFNAEQQRNFRHRSVEVLNIRRRRGSVVLIAERPTAEQCEHHHNEMEARIASGHKFGDTMTKRQILSVPSNIAVATRTMIGSVECSYHEFRGTMLGNSRPKGALMYVTEVAVRPGMRRGGAGAALMRGVDEVAALRNVETIYLHVDIANKAACALYERMGYHYLGKRNLIFTMMMLYCE